MSWRSVEDCYAGALTPYAGSLHQLELIRQAEVATGLSDWGGERWSEAGFRRRLATLCASLEGEADLSPVGRSRAHSRLLAMLVSRLLVCDFRNAQDVPAAIPAPLLGTGLPRTGTSFLHQLLAQDPDNFGARTAEALVPVPPGGSSDDDTWRADLAGRLLDFQGFLSDDISAVHPHGAEAIEEDVLLQEGACGSLFQGFFHVPSFAGSLSEDDLVEMYGWQAGLMQVIRSRRPIDRWVLKAPMHMANLSLVQKVFPGAMLFCSHRDPGKSIPSLASLITTLQGLNHRRSMIDPRQLGPALLTAQMHAVETMSAWRDANPHIPVVDIQFVDLIRDPIGEVERIYGAYGLVLGQKARECMYAFLRTQPHGRAHRGLRHQYDLADFGLTPAIIEQSCDAYVRRYQVASETR